MKKGLGIILFFISVCNYLHAQNPYEAYIAQYMTEGLAINPAFAGNREVLSTSMIYRNSMMGIKDASIQYETFNIHTPLINTKIGVGASLSHISRNPISESIDFFLNYAYRTDFVGGKLALGIKAGIENRRVNYNNLETLIQGDPTFAENVSLLRFNAGIGFQYYSNRFYLGGSVPKLITDSDSLGFNILNYNYFINTGFYFGNIRKAKIGPTLLLNVNPISQLTYIAGLHGNYWKVFGTIGYINYNALLLNFQFKLTEQIHMGLAYERGINEYSRYLGNTIEILLRYEFRYVVRSENPLDF